MADDDDDWDFDDDLDAGDDPNILPPRPLDDASLTSIFDEEDDLNDWDTSQPHQIPPTSGDWCTSPP